MPCLLLASNQAADSLSRHPVMKPEPEKTELMDRQIPKQTLDRSGGPALMVIDTEVITQLQENDWGCRNMKNEL